VLVLAVAERMGNQMAACYGGQRGNVMGMVEVDVPDAVLMEKS
jgi:hypothetical protein